MELPCRLSWHIRKGCPFQVRAGTFVRRLGKFVLGGPAGWLSYGRAGAGWSGKRRPPGMANHLTPLLAGCVSQMFGRVVTAFPHVEHDSLAVDHDFWRDSRSGSVPWDPAWE